MKKLYCSEITYNPYTENNEREIVESVFLVDGYSIADTLLEGVEFHVHFKGDKILSVKVDPEHADFFSNFNESKFISAVEKYAQRAIQGDEVDVPDYIKQKYGFKPNTCAYIK